MSKEALTLKLRVEYETNGESVCRLVRNLEEIGHRSADEGWLTGGSNAIAERWDIDVTEASDDTAVQPLKNTKTQELLDELRRRGLAVVAFTPEDVPAWADYSGVGGAVAWFGRVAERLEERLQELGNGELATAVCHYDLPWLKQDEEV